MWNNRTLPVSAGSHVIVQAYFVCRPSLVRLTSLFDLFIALGASLIRRARGEKALFLGHITSSHGNANCPKFDCGINSGQK